MNLENVGRVEIDRTDVVGRVEIDRADVVALVARADVVA